MRGLERTCGVFSRSEIRCCSWICRNRQRLDVARRRPSPNPTRTRPVTTTALRFIPVIGSVWACAGWSGGGDVGVEALGVEVEPEPDWVLDPEAGEELEPEAGEEVEPGDGAGVEPEVWDVLEASTTIVPCMNGCTVQK